MSRPVVLILDDDTGAAETFSLMLRCHDFDAHVAPDVEAGWTELTRRPPDAIILDLHLGTADGIEFLRRLRGASPGAAIPVAMVTADYLLDDRVTDELCALGAGLHFKPLWEEDLVRIVRGLLAVSGDARLGRPVATPRLPSDECENTRRGARI